MSEVAGLLVLTSNYELKDVVDNDAEIRVVTGAMIQPTEIRKLQELGWDLVGPCVIRYDKMRDTVVDEPRGMSDNDIIIDEVFDAEIDTDLDEE